MVKQYLSLAVIALASFSSSVYAKGVAEIIGCVGETKICNSLDEQRNYAEFVARTKIKEALQNTHSAPIHIVIQSDALDTVMHFQFTAFRDEAIIEGPDGGDIYLPTTELFYDKGVSITGELKNSVKQLVSSDVATRNFAKRIGKEHLLFNGAFDFDEFCNSSFVGERITSRMVSDCEDALFDNGYYNDSHVRKELQHGVEVTFWGQIKAKILSLYEGEGGAEVSYKGAIKKTIEFGSPIKFTTTDGYKFILVPQKDGTAHCTKFVVPPGNEIKVDKDGFIDQEDFEKRLNQNAFRFNKDSLIFLKVQQIVNGARLASLGLLIQMLEECPTCTVTIKDIKEKQNK